MRRGDHVDGSRQRLAHSRARPLAGVHEAPRIARAGEVRRQRVAQLLALALEAGDARHVGTSAGRLEEAIDLLHPPPIGVEGAAIEQLVAGFVDARPAAELDGRDLVAWMGQQPAEVAEADQVGDDHLAVVDVDDPLRRHRDGGRRRRGRARRAHRRERARSPLADPSPCSSPRSPPVPRPHRRLPDRPPGRAARAPRPGRPATARRAASVRARRWPGPPAPGGRPPRRRAQSTERPARAPARPTRSS